MLTIEHYNKIMDNFKYNKNFAFARFNDGEMGGIQRVGFVAARGCQPVDLSLNNALTEALVHRQDDYYKGFPCGTCFPNNKVMYDSLVNQDYPYQTYAVALCNNGHWKKFISEFYRINISKNIVWIGSSDQNVDAVSNLFGLKISTNIKVPGRNAWRIYNEIKTYVNSFNKDDIVLFSCGPMGRVLACEWFKIRQDCTFFDAGSLFDPFTRKVYHGCHTGRLAFCPECNYNV